MNKLHIVLIVVGIAAVVGFYILLGYSNHDEEATEAWHKRLQAAAEAKQGERAIEGVIARVDGPSVDDKLSNVAAKATWFNEKLSVRSEIRTASNLQFRLVPFTLETDEGDFVVDGELIGLGDLMTRKYADGDVEILAARGDAVTVFGTVTERDGVRGFYGEVVIVQAPLREWIERSWKPLVSLPFP